MSEGLQLAFVNVNGAYFPQHNPYDYLHRQFETVEEALILAERYQHRRDKHSEWHEREARLWAGQDVKHALQVLERMPLLPGAQALIAALRAGDVRIALLSDGFDLQVAPVAEAVGAAFVFANRLVVEDELLTGEVEFLLDPARKGALVEDVMAQVGVGPEACLALGCTLSDAQMFARVGWSASVAAYDERVTDAATVTVPEPDLRPLLPQIAALIGAVA